MVRMPRPLAIVALIAVTACDNKPPPPAMAAPEAPKKIAALPPRTQTVRLEKLGLKFDGQRSCSVKDESERSDLKERVQCPGMIFDVAVASHGDPKNFEQAKKAARVHSHLVVQKEDQTADGWNIQFHSSDLGTDLYQVWVRRKIGTKQYECDATTTEADEASKSASACVALAALE